MLEWNHYSLHDWHKVTQSSYWDEIELWSHVFDAHRSGPPASESDCLSTRLLCLSVVWHVEATWRNTDALARICRRCCASCGGELGSSWVAGQCAGPPWLAPVILPSHSSARDINNNSTSGFTLLSHVNPFYSAASGLGLKPPSPTKDPLLLLSVFVSLSHLQLQFPFSASHKASPSPETLCANTSFSEEFAFDFYKILGTCF